MKEILDWLKHGIHIDSAAQAYIHSTFSAKTPGEIAYILHQEEGCEKDSLLDLLFYPNEAIQIRIEKLLVGYGLDQKEEQFIAGVLRDTKPQSVIHFPGIGAVTTILVPDSVIDNLMKRLRLSKHLDDALLQTMKTHIPEPNILSIRVRIRNAELPDDSWMFQFLNLFVKKIQYDDGCFRDCLDFILGFLPALTRFNDMYGALALKKQQLVALLRQAENYQRRLQKANAEIIMLTGNKLPYIDMEGLRKTLGIIDLLVLKLYGQAILTDLLPEEIYRIRPQDQNALLEDFVNRLD